MIFGILVSIALAQGSTDELLLPKYQKWMEQFPAKKDAVKTCALPLPKLNRRTREFRTAIGYHFKEGGSKANFCAKYFAMATPISGGGALFIFDCNNGKPYVYSEKYALFIHPDTDVSSCALVANGPSKYISEDEIKKDKFLWMNSPNLFHWNGNSLNKVKDPFWPKLD